MARLPRGLYAITPDWQDTARLLGAVETALQGGARVLQYRNKAADAALRLAQASALLPLCRHFGVPLIINDHLDLALLVGADGLHLGAEDGDLAAARLALGPDRLLGASCYNRLELAHAALHAGADHVAFGAAYPSATKPGARHASLHVYEAARIELNCPVVAIGGITPDNAAPLIAAGVNNLAVIGALFEVADVGGASLAFVGCFSTMAGKV
jgi:thiamine-phosphate pyrophosphorylase